MRPAIRGGGLPSRVKYLANIAPYATLLLLAGLLVVGYLWHESTEKSTVLEAQRNALREENVQTELKRDSIEAVARLRADSLSDMQRLIDDLHEARHQLRKALRRAERAAAEAEEPEFVFAGTQNELAQTADSVLTARLELAGRVGVGVPILVSEEGLFTGPAAMIVDYVTITTRTLPAMRSLQAQYRGLIREDSILIARQADQIRRYERNEVDLDRIVTLYESEIEKRRRIEQLYAAELRRVTLWRRGAIVGAAVGIVLLTLK